MDEDGLTRRQQRFVAALGALCSTERAAVIAGVDVSTAYRWMRRPAVRRAVDEVYALVQDAVLKHVCARLELAMETLETVMNEPKTPEAVRVAAATVVVNAAVRLVATRGRPAVTEPAERSAELVAIWERARIALG